MCFCKSNPHSVRPDLDQRNYNRETIRILYKHLKNDESNLWVCQRFLSQFKNNSMTIHVSWYEWWLAHFNFDWVIIRTWCLCETSRLVFVSYFYTNNFFLTKNGNSQSFRVIKYKLFNLAILKIKFYRSEMLGVLQ